MRCLCLTAVVALSVHALTSCGGGGSGIAASGSYNPGYGPFDKHGNYVEAWADKPARKHWWGGTPKPAAAPKPTAPKTQAPAIAKTTTPAPKPTTTPRTPTATEVASLGRARTVSQPRPPASSTYRPPPPRTTYTPPAPKPAAPAVAYTPPPPKAAPKPAPKPTPVKPAKPAPVRHTVRKGDTLYALSRRYGTTVSAIQKANGIRGTTIITGKTYLIPR